MALVYISIAVGAAGFLVWIIIEYLNVSTGLKPKADMALQEIGEAEMQIESEQAANDATKQEVEDLKKEIGDLEKKLTAMAKKVEEERRRTSRSTPTKFKVEE